MRRGGKRGEWGMLKRSFFGKKVQNGFQHVNHNFDFEA